MKDRMIAGPDDGVEIARDAAVRSGVAFARQTDTLAIASARLNADFERFGVRHRAVAVTSRAGGQIFPSAVAARTLHVEFHASASLCDLAGAVAFGALARGLDSSLPVAGGADVVARDVEAHDAATNGGPERDVDLIFEVGAGLGTFLGLSGTAAAAEDSGKDVAEAAAPAAGRRGGLATPGAVDEVGKIESSKVEGDTLAAGLLPSGKTGAPSGSSASVSLRSRRINIVGVKADLVVDLALLGIAENFVSFGECLELFLGCFVAGIDVGMELAGELAEGLANVVCRGGLLYAEDFVIIFFGGCGHLLG